MASQSSWYSVAEPTLGQRVGSQSALEDEESVQGYAEKSATGVSDNVPRRCGYPELGQLDDRSLAAFFFAPTLLGTPLSLAAKLR